MGLEAGGRAGTEKKEKEEKEEEEKIPHMCESLGHRPLWGRCPEGKGEKKTNLLKLSTSHLERSTETGLGWHLTMATRQRPFST